MMQPPSYNGSLSTEARYHAERLNPDQRAKAEKLIAMGAFRNVNTVEDLMALLILWHSPGVNYVELSNAAGCAQTRLQAFGEAIGLVQRRETKNQLRNRELNTDPVHVINNTIIPESGRFTNSNMAVSQPGIAILRSRKAEFLELWRSGMTIIKIAAHFGVTWATLKHFYLEIGLKQRPKKELSASYGATNLGPLERVEGNSLYVAHLKFDAAFRAAFIKAYAQSGGFYRNVDRNTLLKEKARSDFPIFITPKREVGAQSSI